MVHMQWMIALANGVPYNDDKQKQNHYQRQRQRQLGRQTTIVKV